MSTEIEQRHRSHILFAISVRQGHTTDSVFASTLGVPTQALQAARRGGHTLGIPLLASLVRIYPELEQAATAYLWALISEQHETLKRDRPSRWYPQE